MSHDESALAKCQQIIGYQFNDQNLLSQALVHASSADNRLLSNERLEFFGDSVLGQIICRELYERFPHYLEGELTKIKSMVVSRRICTRVADKLGLGDFLQVGKGMLSNRELPPSCSAAALEAIIGAIYIDGGEAAAREFVLRSVGPYIEHADASRHQENFKSMLQQHTQHVLDTTPLYEMLDEKGPDHSKCFEVGVVINQRRLATAWGPSKKEAEQLAAFRALQELEEIPADQVFPGVTETQ